MKPELTTTGDRPLAGRTGSSPSASTQKGQWTVVISQRDLGWMAGVLDLKGRISLKSNQTRATKQAVLAVQTGEIAVIRRLGDLTGTSPEVMRAKPLKDFMRKNCSTHCPDKHSHVLYDELKAFYRQDPVLTSSS